MSLQFFSENTGILKNAVFCFTGKSPKPRREMVAIANRAGAAVNGSIMNMTTILVIADANSMSAKAQKAREIGLNLISPTQFFEMCSDDKSTNQFKITKPEPIIEHSKEKRKHSSTRRIQL